MNVTGNEFHPGFQTISYIPKNDVFLNRNHDIPESSADNAIERVIAYSTKFDANFIELPEHIFVETRFITRQNIDSFAKTMPQLNTQGTKLLNCSLINSNLPGIEVLNENSPQLQLSADMFSDFVVNPGGVSTVRDVFGNMSPSQILPPAKTYEDKSVDAVISQSTVKTMTESPYPKRDRYQQTYFGAEFTATIGIQCNVEKDLDDIAFEALKPEKMPIENDTKNIEAFFERNLLILPYGKCECLICGEIGISSFLMKPHMKLHMEPPSLCFSCGKVFSNKLDLKKHELHRHSKDKKSTKKYKIRCPYYKCNKHIEYSKITAHMQKHRLIKYVECSDCNENDFTSKKTQKHILNCIKQKNGLSKSRKVNSVYRKRVPKQFGLKLSKSKKKLFSTYHQSKILCCNFCAARYMNVSSLFLHAKRCEKKYALYLKKEFLKEFNSL